MPKLSWKRIGLALTGLFLGLPLLFVIGAVLWNHGTNLVARFMEPPAPTEEQLGMVLPEQPLPGDDTMVILLKISEPVHQAYKNSYEWNRNCLGSNLTKPVDWNGCANFLAQQQAALKTFDDWVAHPSPYNLDRPANLGRHLRFAVDKFTIDTRLSYFNPAQSLARVLGMRTLQRLRQGDVAGAESDLRKIVAIGSFFQQSPVLSTQYVGWGIHDSTTLLLARSLPPGASGDRVAVLLPDLRNNREVLKQAYGFEVLSVHNDLKNDVFSGSQINWLWTASGAYSRDLTLRQLRRQMSEIMAQVDRDKLGTAFSAQQRAEACQAPEFPLPVGSNLLGKWIVCALDISVYTARFGSAIDRMEAAKVVIAARRFSQKEKRWPTKESDLVPKYLQAWPVSALDGQPLRWRDDKRGIQVLDLDGKTPCRNDDCQFPFEPSMPVGKA